MKSLGLHTCEIIQPGMHRSTFLLPGTSTFLLPGASHLNPRCHSISHKDAHFLPHLFQAIIELLLQRAPRPWKPLVQVRVVGRSYSCRSTHGGWREVRCSTCWSMLPPEVWKLIVHSLAPPVESGFQCITSLRLPLQLLLNAFDTGRKLRDFPVQHRLSTNKRSDLRFKSPHSLFHGTIVAFLEMHQVSRELFIHWFLHVPPHHRQCSTAAPITQCGNVPISFFGIECHRACLCSWGRCPGICHQIPRDVWCGAPLCYSHGACRHSPALKMMGIMWGTLATNPACTTSTIRCSDVLRADSRTGRAGTH
mmetsp:Transcript_29588/g.57187  ORF Transcript_29588/g.57187 Transcript_29588/m.57187 type:complete len:308 (-) Transcript_29588:194-1117(-)